MSEEVKAGELVTYAMLRFANASEVILESDGRSVDAALASLRLAAGGTPASCSPNVDVLIRQLRGRADFLKHEVKSPGLMRQAADALESMMREKDAMGWQPIETAPRDGTHILAAIAGKTFGYEQPVLAAVVHWFNDPEEPGFYTSVNELAPERTFEATHWMPLPAPPRAALDMTLDKGR